MIRDYIAIDLETTGLNPKEDAIIEIGAVKVRNGILTEEFHTMVNPGRIIPARVVELTGITQREVGEAPDFQTIMGNLQNFLGDDVLLGHNIMFDYSFLKRSVVNHGGVTNKGQDTFEKQGIDTLKLARIFLPQLESRRLDYLCKYYHIPLQSHRALEDAKGTAQLYEAFLLQFDEERALLPVSLSYQVKKEGPLTKAQKERLYMLTAKHKIIVDYDIEFLTKNEASRHLDRILAEYGR